MENKKLVLLGGGHAHMVTLANLRNFVGKGFDVTVIQPSEYHYYSGMGPGMLGGTYQPDDIRFATRKIVERQGGTFVLAKAAAIDPEKQVVRLEESGQEVEYDVLSCNVGSFVPRDLIRTDSAEIFTAKPIESLLQARQKILAMSKERPLRLAVIGGGPFFNRDCRQRAAALPAPVGLPATYFDLRGQAAYGGQAGENP